jgi:DNA-binding transcriptional MerR regulator
MARAEEGWMTIEELSIRSGVTTRNIRAYQSRGLLPAPVARPGQRASFYTPEHLTRLRLVSRLQERGFSLAGIADLISAWAEGKSVEQVLGIDAAIAESNDAEEPRVMSVAEIRALVPKGVDAAESIRKLEAAGLIARREKGYRVQHPSVLQLGLDALAAGIPFDVIPEEFVRLQGDLRRIAERFVALYVKHAIDPFLEAGMPADKLPEILERLKRMRKLAVDSMLPLMRQAMADEIEAAVRAHLPAPTEGQKNESEAQNDESKAQSK